jgi:hypothetical protein
MARLAADLSWENTVVNGRPCSRGNECREDLVSEADKQEAKAAKKADLQRQRKAKMKSSRLTSVK